MNTTEIVTYVDAPTAKRGAKRAIKNGKNPAGKTKFMVKPYQGKFMIDWLSDEMAEFAPNEAVETDEDTPVEVEQPTEPGAELIEELHNDEPEDVTPVEEPKQGKVSYPTEDLADKAARAIIDAGQAPAPYYEIVTNYTYEGNFIDHSIVWADTPFADDELPTEVPGDGRRGKGRKKGGVLDKIESLLLNTPDGVTLAHMVSAIAAETGRPEEHILATVKTQLSRMPKTRDLRIKRERRDGVLYYSAVKGA